MRIRYVIWKITQIDQLSNGDDLGNRTTMKIITTAILMAAIFFGCEGTDILSVFETDYNDPLVLFEQFNRTNGLPWNDWEHKYHFQETYLDSQALMIVSNELVSICRASNSTYYAEQASLYRNKELYNDTMLPVEVTFTIRFNTFAAWGDANQLYLVLGSSGSSKATTGTGVFFDGRSDKIGIVRDGMVSNLTSFTLDDDKTRYCKIKINSDGILMKLWETAEPETWNLNVSLTFKSSGNYLEIYSFIRSDTSYLHSFLYLDDLKILKQ